MAKLGKENVFLVEVEDKLALIDRNAGMIHIVDAANAERWNNGEEFATISSEKSIIQAGSGSVGGGSTPKDSGFASDFDSSDTYTDNAYEADQW